MAESPRTIITDALVALNAYEAGQPPAPEEMTFGFRVLNRIIDAWRAQYDWYAYARVQMRFTLVSGVGTYTMGPGGDFDMPRPEGRQPGKGILQCNIAVQSGTLENMYPVMIFTPDQWMQVTTPAMSGGPWPWAVVTDGNYPLQNLTFYEKPVAVNDVIFLVAQQVLEFTDVDQDFALPPIWRSGLINNLARQMASGIRRDARAVQIPSEVHRLADEAIRVLNSVNSDGFNTHANWPGGHESNVGGGPTDFTAFRGGGVYW